MEENMENEIETGMSHGIIQGLGFPKIRGTFSYVGVPYLGELPSQLAEVMVLPRTAPLPLDDPSLLVLT